MLTHYIGNITRVEPGQIIVVVGKTTDAAARYFLIHTSRLIVQINCWYISIEIEWNNTHCYRFVDRLDLNLRSGKNKNDDIIFNLSVNFHEKVITRNSRSNGEWGAKECDENLFEREDDSLNPFLAGKINIIYRNFWIKTDDFFLCVIFNRRNIQIICFNLWSKILYCCQ